MQEKAQAKPIDPNNEPTDSKPVYATCNQCMAHLPLNCYGYHRMEKSGKSKTCSECRAQVFRLKRKAKYNSKSMADDSIVRHVYNHNKSLIALLLSIPEVSCIGFIPHTDKVFRIDFGRSRYDLKSMAIFNEDGTSYFEIAYSGVEDPEGTILLNLKKHSIRLELTTMHMMASKNTIYHLWEK